MKHVLQIKYWLLAFVLVLKKAISTHLMHFRNDLGTFLSFHISFHFLHDCTNFHKSIVSRVLPCIVFHFILLTLQCFVRFSSYAFK